MTDDPSAELKARLETLLEAGLAELGLVVAAHQVDSLARFATELARWGKRLNLSGHRDPEAIVRRLVLDAAALSTVLPPVASLNDLGSGAGLPGIPLAILRPDCHVHLVEARERRHHFLREMARSLRAVTLSVERGRIEALAPRPRSCAIAQAVGPPDRVIDWILPWTDEGGWVAIPASGIGPTPADDPRLEPGEVRDYAVPLGGPRRRLWLARRPAR